MFIPIPAVHVGMARRRLTQLAGARASFRGSRLSPGFRSASFINRILARYRFSRVCSEACGRGIFRVTVHIGHRKNSCTCADDVIATSRRSVFPS